MASDGYDKERMLSVREYDVDDMNIIYSRIMAGAASRDELKTYYNIPDPKSFTIFTYYSTLPKNELISFDDDMIFNVNMVYNKATKLSEDNKRTDSMSESMLTLLMDTISRGGCNPDSFDVTI